MSSARSLIGISVLVLLVPAAHATRQPRFDLRARAGPVVEVAFLPDGRLAAAYPDETIRLWDLTKRSVALAIQVRGASADGAVAAARQGERIESIAVSPDGALIAEAFSLPGGGGELRLWDAVTGQRRLQVDTGLANLRCVAFSPDGKLVACNMPDKERGGHAVALLSAADGKVVRRLRADRLGVSGVAFSPDGKRLASFGGVRVHVWDLEQDKPPLELTGHSNALQALAWSPDGETIASAEAGPKERIILWNARSGAKLREIKPEAEGIADLAFSPSGKTLAAAGMDRGLRLFNPETGKLRERLFFHLQKMTCVAFSRDGRTLASGAHDGLIGIWDYDETLPDIEPSAEPNDAAATGKRRK